MSTRPGQVAKRQGGHHGPERHETAFHVWAGHARRSLRQTSAITGIPRATLATWHAKEGWNERADGMWRDAAKSSDAIVQDLLASGQGLSMLTLLDILASKRANPNARVKAAELVLGLGGHVVPKAPQVRVTHEQRANGAPTISSSVILSLSPADLDRWTRTGELPDHVTIPESIPVMAEDREP